MLRHLQCRVLVAVPLVTAGFLCALAQTSNSADSLQGGNIIHVTTREVVVDIVAQDRHEHPVDDLQLADFSVSELNGRTRVPQRVTAVRFVPPLSSQSNEKTNTLHVRLGSGCGSNILPHYELTYHVSANEIREGNHRLEIETGRHGVQLSYGAHYDVAGTTPFAVSRKPESAHDSEERLLQAACLHATGVLALPLNAKPIAVDAPGEVRYQLVIPPEALPLASVNVSSRNLSLEYGACSFDSDGKPLHFGSSPELRSLRIGEYAQATVHGLPLFIQVPTTDYPATIRFVVRDRVTGNMGTVLVTTPAAPRFGDLTPGEAKSEERWEKHISSSTPEPDINFPPMGAIGSFGSLQPRPGALCGDVYELQPGTANLPHFWSLDSIGSLYADVIDVPHQQFWNTAGLPGVTRATAWFGIDYYGAFYVQSEGQYEFRLIADDGAKLYIDDQLIVNDDSIHNVQVRTGKVTLKTGWHTLHLPYFQGPPPALALQLFVRNPGEKLLRLFDIIMFRDPAHSAADPR